MVLLLATRSFWHGSASSATTTAGGRTIVIGDVHGCRQELEMLLAKLEFDRSRGDAVIFVGDLVGKGPDPFGTVSLALEIGARMVRGNQ